MEPIVHKLKNPRALTRLAVIGCGGTGAPFIGGLPYLDQSLRATGHPGLEVVVVDGDKVSPINCVRQPFSESEIGLHKSVVLVNRLNLFWNLRWLASTQYVTRSTQGAVDIVVSCVDTREARLEIVNSPLMKECMYWLDIGNNADSGQFVLGQPKNSRNRRHKHRLPVVSELFPEIVTPNPAAADDLPSCSAVEALERQEPFINQTLAYQALAVLARLFRHGQITHNGAFLDIRNGRMTPLAVDPKVWRRIMKLQP
jgi:PRTRC genetic system ThiF family protein